MRMRSWADGRVRIERARGDDHFPSAAREMRQRRAASRAKGRRKAARRRQIKAHDKLLPRVPRELLRNYEQVGSVSAAGRLAAPRAMTMHKIQERFRDPIRNRAAKTTTAEALFHPWKLAMNITNSQRHLQCGQIVPSLDAAQFTFDGELQFSQVSVLPSIFVSPRMIFPVPHPASRTVLHCGAINPSRVL